MLETIPLKRRLYLPSRDSLQGGRINSKGLYHPPFNYPPPSCSFLNCMRQNGGEKPIILIYPPIGCSSGAFLSQFSDILMLEDLHNEIIGYERLELNE